MKTSIKQISELTGFSPATVSNALNHKRGVNQITSDKIFKVAREIGYLSENKITKIKLVIYKRNGLIIDDSPFFSVLLKGVEGECRNSGYELLMCNLDREDPDYECQVEQIMNDSSCAIILLGTELLEDEFPRFQNGSAPVVLLDCWCSTYPMNAVLINNADSSANAVRYLVEKGHRKIGYLKGDFRIKAFSSRFQGYSKILDQYDINEGEKYIFEVSTTIDGAYRDMKRYIADGREMPTAFFADDDMIALGCIKAFHESGYRVPEDISIIGFDDLPFCEVSSPRLTTIKVLKYEMGQMAVRRVVDMIKDGGSICMKTQICTEFVERDSVADLNSEI